MALPHPAARVDRQDYFAWEAEQPVKHEHVAGEVFAQTGARQNHVLVAGNCFAALRQRLRGTPCRAYISDMQLEVVQADAVFYPDVVVSCHPEDLLATGDSARALVLAALEMEIGFDEVFEDVAVPGTQAGAALELQLAAGQTLVAAEQRQFADLRWGSQADPVCPQRLMRMRVPIAAAGQLLPLFVSADEPLEGPLHLDTCQIADSSNSATAVIGAMLAVNELAIREGQPRLQRPLL